MGFLPPESLFWNEAEVAKEFHGRIDVGEGGELFGCAAL